MAFTLNITTSGAAFLDDGAGYEVSRILGDIAEKVRDGHTEGIARDYNGNTVGNWSLTD